MNDELASLLFVATLITSVITFLVVPIWLPYPGGRMVNAGRSNPEIRKLVWITVGRFVLVGALLAWQFIEFMEPFPATVLVAIALLSYLSVLGYIVGRRSANLRWQPDASSTDDSTADFSSQPETDGIA